MSYYVKQNNLEFYQQIKLLADNIEGIKSLFGFLATDITEAKNDADFMLWISNENNNADTFYHSSTDYTYTVRHGNDDNKIIPVPVLTVNPIDPVVVPEGIQKRYTQKINQIKASKNCSDDLLKKLDVFSTVVAKDSTLAKPDPKVTLDGGSPVISYHKYGFAAANLYKDSGKGYDATPYKTMTTTSFKDPATLPAAGLSVVWKYKVMYLLNDEESGIMSDEVSIAVKGK